MKLRIIVLTSLCLFMNDAFPQEFFEAKVHERDMGTSRNKIGNVLVF